MKVCNNTVDPVNTLATKNTDIDKMLLNASQQNSQTVIVENTDPICYHHPAGADFHTDYSAVARQMLNF